MTPHHEAVDTSGKTRHCPPMRQGLNWRLIVPLIGGLLLFVALCVGGTLFAMSYLERLESLEKKTASSLDATRLATSDRQLATSASSMTSNTSQPQIYFMVGGQGGGVPVPYQTGVPGYYQTAPSFQAQQPLYQPYYHQSQVDITQFLMQKYGGEYNEYVRSYMQAQTAPGMPSRRETEKPARHMTLPYVVEEIRVPTKLTLDLRKSFTRDALVEEWFKEEAAQNFGFVEDGTRLPGTPQPTIDDILKNLAETTFADKKYERTARIYAELASRQVHLSVEELLRWAKASELSGDIESSLKILDLVYKNDPGNTEVLKEMAAILVGNQRFSEAAESYKKLMEVEPDVRDWRVMRAKTLTWSNRGTEAVELMRQLHAETPMDMELAVMLAELLLSEHYFIEALPLLDQLIANSPDDDSLKLRKLNTLEALQRFPEAADLTTELLARDPENEELLLKLAANRMGAQQFAMAADPYERYLLLRPDDHDVRERLAESYMATGNFGLAAMQFGILSDAKPDDAVIKGKYANALLAAQDFDRASYVYSYLVEDKPGNRELAMSYVVSLRMGENLNEAYNAAVYHLGIDESDRKMMIQAAEIAAELRQYDNAVKWYRSGVRLEQNDAEARIALGNTLVWGGEYEAAEHEFRAAVQQMPNNYKARRGLARALFFQRKYDEAFDTYGSMMREDPSDTVIAAERRYFEAISVGMEDEAQRQLLILIDFEPDEIVWKGDRVQSLLRQHRFEEAISAADVVYEQDQDYRTTRVGMMNANEYLTSYPVDVHFGYQKKTSEKDDNHPDRDRQAKLTYKWMGIHGEGSLGPNWRVGADFDREFFDMRTDGVKNVNADRLKASAIHEGNPNLWARGELGYRRFRDGKGVDDQVLYNVRAELRELGGMPLNVGVFTRRGEHYDNWQNVYDNLYAYDFGVDAVYRYKKWDFEGRLQGKVLTDNNSQFNFASKVQYRLFESPCLMMQVGGDFEYQDWKYTRPKYYSPQDMYQYGISVDGRYYLCRDPETWGGPETYIDFELSMYLDRYRNFGHKMAIGFNHDWSTKFSTFARAGYTKESYYKEFNLYGGLQYKFGGCEE